MPAGPFPLLRDRTVLSQSAAVRVAAVAVVLVALWLAVAWAVSLP